MQSLSWCYHRLSVMSLLEISHRLYRSCRALIGLFHHWPKADDLSINQVWEGPCTAQYFRSRSNPFFCGVEQLSPSDFPGKFRREVIEEAEQLLSHKFSFFSFRGTVPNEGERFEPFTGKTQVASSLCEPLDATIAVF